MPELKKETKNRRAQKLTKTYIENDFNQAETAKQLGVSRQVINKKIHTPEVKDCLAKYLDSEKLRRRLIKVANEGMSATKVISAFVIVKKDKEEGAQVGEPNPEVRNMLAGPKAVDFIDIPDHKTRHKFWHDLMTATGPLKITNGKGVHVSTIILNIGSQSGLLSKTEAGLIPSERSKV